MNVELEQPGESKINHLLNSIRNRGWRWIIGVIAFLALMYIANLLIQVYPTEGLKYAELNPWILDLISFLSSVASAFLCALLVAVLIDYQSIRNYIINSNVHNLIEAVYNPGQQNLTNIPPDQLIEFSHNAVASALGIEKGSDAFGLIGVCFSEMSDRATSPYALMHSSRRYQYDPVDPNAVHVIDDLECKFINPSDKEYTKKLWRRLSSGAIEPSQDKYLDMVCCMSIEKDGIVVKDSQEFIVRGSEEGANRLFVNNDESSSILIPPHSDNVLTNLHREFYIPVSECESTFEWEYPLKELTYRATFEGREAAFDFSMIKCSLCNDSTGCANCDKGAVTIRGIGTPHMVLNMKNWISSTSGLKLTWKYAD